MTEPLGPTPEPSWLRLRRFFHLDGNLGGLRYSARVRIFDLNAADPLPLENEIMSAAQPKLLGDRLNAEVSTDSADANPES